MRINFTSLILFLYAKHISYFFHFCDKMPDKFNLRRKGLSLTSGPGITFQHVREGIAWPQSRKQLVTVHSNKTRERERDECGCSASFVLYMKPKTPSSSGPTFGRELPTSVKLIQVDPSQTCPRLMPMMILDSVTK